MTELRPVTDEELRVCRLVGGDIVELIQEYSPALAMAILTYAVTRTVLALEPPKGQTRIGAIHAWYQGVVKSLEVNEKGDLQ